MRNMIFLGGICLVAASALATVGPAQSEQWGPVGDIEAPVQQPTTSPSKPKGPAIPGQVITGVGGTKVAPLTVTECDDLGGTVKAGITACLSGKACQTTGEDGKVRAVCISKKAGSEKRTPKAPAGTVGGTMEEKVIAPSKPKGPSIPGQVITGVGGTKIAPLTVAECEGLGGKAAVDTKCSTGKTCIRADQDGVLHQACITKK